MVNIGTTVMIKTEVLNFRSSVPIVQCQNKKKVCIPHLSKYANIQMDLHEAKQIKYNNDYIINILYINLWMSEYKFMFEDSSLLESVIW
jgi:hypothetical protein